MWLTRAVNAIGRGISQGILGVIVLVCIAISVFFAFEFGYGKAASLDFAWAYGLASGGLDLFKARLPLIASAAYNKAKRTCAWGAFAFLTAMSLFCAFGTTAGQLAEKFASQMVAKTGAKDKTDKLERLRRDRDAIGPFIRTTLEMVKSQQSTVDALHDQIATETARGGCKHDCKERERDEREARALLTKLQTDQATTAQADKLDGEISETEDIKVDVKTAERDIDPQATSISKVFGIPVERAALISQIIFALAIEIGSGFGLWLVFCHGGHTPARAPVPVKSPEPEPKPEPQNEAELQKADRKRFFDTCVFHGTGKHPAGIMHGAYLAWHKSHGSAPPMGVQAFGTRSPWMAKKRIGGVVHYLNCGIVSGLVPTPQSKLQVVASTPGRRQLGRPKSAAALT